MILFYSETDFLIDKEQFYRNWIETVIKSEKCSIGNINYIFCDDEYLHKVNMEYLSHDTLTDIISFDYSVGKELHGDVFISIERVRENAGHFGVTFNDELSRVMVHGILHYCGYKDKTDNEKKEMRNKEDYYLTIR